MMRFRDRPIRAKLLVIVVATTAAALVVSVTLSILYEYFALRERFALDQSILTRITANNATAAVAFKSAIDAQEVLERLGDDPSILVAEIVTTDGRVLASYRRSGVDKDLDAPRIWGDERYSFDADTLVTAAEIRTESLALGTVFVRSDLAVINSFLARDAMISFALAVLACALAAGAATLLQRSISIPIRQLSDVADQVTQDEMHRGRATKLGDDEVGRLVDSFNEMLDRIRQREIALAESEANYRMLSEQASDGILLWTEDQRIQFANPAACEMFGYSEFELRNLRMSDVFERGDGEARIPTLDELHEGKAVPSEGPCRRKDGSQLWTESRSKMLEDGRVQSIVRDLSERHEMESRLGQAQRMETVGQLAGGVAHDFNNLLTVISGGCELALDRGKLSSEDAEEISDVARAAERAASLTRQLLAFSRQQVLQPTPLDLNKVISELEKLLRRLIGEDISIETSLCPELGYVVADLGQIEQVIVNLAVNARDAMPEGGAIHITTERIDLTDASDGVPPGSYVVLGVRDSGCGMDDTTLSRIFEPFYTTKQRGEGTGLGLATVYGVIRQSGGHIAVESAPGAGTYFSIHLPRVDSAPPVLAEGSRDSGVSHGSETVLVVEDEDLVRQLIRRMLESSGYRVREAKDGAQALEIVGDASINVDAVITDFVMPGITGLELAQRLRERRPELPILYISGYAGDDLSRRGLATLGDAFLSKPFSKEKLIEKLRTVLRS